MIEEDHYVYLKRSKKSALILSLYVDNIPIARNDMDSIVATKKWLSSTFEMKDMGEAYFVLGIEIVRDRSKKLLGLSQEFYIKKILSLWQVGHKVHRDVLPLSLDYLQWSELPCWSLMLSPYLLTYEPLSNKIPNLSLHPVPVILTTKITVHLCATWMHEKTGAKELHEDFLPQIFFLTGESQPVPYTEDYHLNAWSSLRHPYMFVPSP